MAFWKKFYKSKYTGKEIDAAVGNVPVVTSADAGKALVVDEEGKIVAGEAGGGNPIRIWRKDTEDTYAQEFDRVTNTVKTINGLPAAAIIDDDVLVIDKDVTLGFILNLSQADYTAILNATNDDYSFSFTTTALFSPISYTQVLITVANDAVLAGWNSITPKGPDTISLGSCYVGSYEHDVEMSLSTVDDTFTYTFTFKTPK